ncbi:GntR family transcriptional regulator [Rhizobium sp. TRM95111]|nr:GntR family transcriptional regulator [Rhizobium alarense]
MILAGDLPPGTIVSEMGLAKRLGVSRTPVREAIRLLSEDGLITLRPRQRPVVALPSLADALDQFEALAMLEADCSELAARRCTTEARGRIQALHETCGRHFENGDVAAYFNANEGFHQAISEASNNAYLAGRAVHMRQRLRSLRAPRASEPDRMRDSFAEHGAIVAAIVAGDPVAARQTMLAHVAMVGERTTDFIRAYSRRWDKEEAA